MLLEAVVAGAGAARKHAHLATKVTRLIVTVTLIAENEVETGCSPTQVERSRRGEDAREASGKEGGGGVGNGNCYDTGNATQQWANSAWRAHDGSLPCIQYRNAKRGAAPVCACYPRCAKRPPRWSPRPLHPSTIPTEGTLTCTEVHRRGGGGPRRLHGLWHTGQLSCPSVGTAALCVPAQCVGARSVGWASGAIGRWECPTVCASASKDAFVATGKPVCH